MASDNTPAKPEGLEHQDQSIKDRKFQLFEETKPDGDGVLRKPFSQYVRQAPPAPLSPVIKASLWATGVLVALLFLGAIFIGPKVRKRQAALPPAHPAAESPRGFV